MKLSTYLPSARRARIRVASVATLASLFAVGLLVALVGGAQAAATAVPLGTADSFAVLAGAGITNTGPTTVNGDIGTFPTTTITGAGVADHHGHEPRRRRRHAAGEDRPRHGVQQRRRRGADIADRRRPRRTDAASRASTTPPPRSASPERSRSTAAATRTPSSSSRPARR